MREAAGTPGQQAVAFGGEGAGGAGAQRPALRQKGAGDYARLPAGKSKHAQANVAAARVLPGPHKTQASRCLCGGESKHRKSKPSHTHLRREAWKQTVPPVLPPPLPACRPPARPPRDKWRRASAAPLRPWLLAAGPGPGPRRATHLGCSTSWTGRVPGASAAMAAPPAGPWLRRAAARCGGSGCTAVTGQADTVLPGGGAGSPASCPPRPRWQGSPEARVLSPRACLAGTSVPRSPGGGGAALPSAPRPPQSRCDRKAAAMCEGNFFFLHSCQNLAVDRKTPKTVPGWVHRARCRLCQPAPCRPVGLESPSAPCIGPVPVLRQNARVMKTIHWQCNSLRHYFPPCFFWCVVLPAFLKQAVSQLLFTPQY